MPMVIRVPTFIRKVRVVRSSKKFSDVQMKSRETQLSKLSFMIFHFKEKVACMMKFDVNYHHARHNLAAATMDQLIVPAVTVPKYIQ